MKFIHQPTVASTNGSPCPPDFCFEGDCYNECPEHGLCTLWDEQCGDRDQP